MTSDEARTAMVVYWMEKADHALTAADTDIRADQLEFAMSHAYYMPIMPASTLRAPFF